MYVLCACLAHVYDAACMCLFLLRVLKYVREREHVPLCHPPFQSRTSAADVSILFSARLWAGGWKGDGVIVAWTSHTTIIQQSYNNPYNHPYNNSFFLDEERHLSRGKTNI